ncbi:MAG: MFS transporter [Oscillospiraceae bacterium]|nr:MFS transporter [Oscillospiraceae bacterium]MBO5918225.1 MFS transporter [Oscillospiraceae bacterium]
MFSFKQRPHYAWVICFGTALTLFVALGLGINVLSFFTPDIILEKGFSNSQASLLPTVRNLFSLLSMLMVNPLCRRFGARKVIGLGNLLVAACYLGFAFFDSFFAYCCCAALLGVGYTFGGSVPVAFILVKWFETRRSLAMGISAATSGLALLVAPPILTGLIARFGLNTTFLIHSGLCLLLALVAILLLHNTPEELSMTPYNEAENKKVKEKAPPRLAEPPHVTRLQNGMILLTTALFGGPIGVGYTQISVLLRTEGYDEMLVASVISLMGMLIMVSKVLCADLYDRVGGWRGNFIVCGMAAVGLALLTLTPLGCGPLVFLAVFLYGFGLSSGSISTYQWSADLYGANGYADGVRSFNMAYTLGSLAFGPIPGVIADWFGSYVPAFVLFLGIFIVAFAMLQGLYHRLGLHKV